MKGDREDDIRAGMNGYVTEPLRAKGLYEAIEGHSSPHSKRGAHIPRENRPEEPVFDCKLALARIEGDLELMRELAGLFFTEAPRLLAEVRSSTVRADGPALQRNAHKLKGAVGCFAAKGAMDAAQALEVLGDEGNFAGAQEAYERLENAISLLRSALTLWLGDPSGESSIKPSEVL